jgi:hypothetical protein
MFCQFCGVALSKQTKYCNKCGAQLIDTKTVDEAESLRRRASFRSDLRRDRVANAFD